MTERGEKSPLHAMSEAEQPDQRVFIERFGAAYAPAPRQALQRAAFTRQVMERLPQTRGWSWQPLAAAAVAACLALWLTFGAAPAPQVAAQPGATLFAFALDDDAPLGSDEEFLPDDYAVLAASYER